MAAKKKKTTNKKKITKTRTKTKSSQKPPVLSEIKKILVGIAILISVCLTVAMIADIFLKPGKVENKEPKLVKPQQQLKPKIKQKPVREVPVPEIPVTTIPVTTIPETTIIVKAKKEIREIQEIKIKKNVAGLKHKPEGSFKYEVFGEVDQSLIEKRFPKPDKDHIPKIVIIIDDIGYDKKIAMALYNLNSKITFSILPFAPFGKTISKQLNAKGSQLMLHLPMEPFEYPAVNPGPGAILSSMSPDTLLNQLKKNINDIPNIVGVNNHMGSRITTNSDKMNQIFSVLKKENLFFIDSRTAPNSKCKAAARLFKLEFAQRDIFLDNFQNIDYITRQFKKLVVLAEKHGFAIGIGHPYKATFHALEKELPKLKNKIEIVPASALTSIPR